MKADHLLVSLQLERKAFHLSINEMIPAKGVTAVFGHSGAGKTTLLRCIAGLEPNVTGEISVAGEQWLAQGINRRVHQRSVGYVFQQSALFPHLDVAGNLVYAKKRASTARAGLCEREILSMLELDHLQRHFPSQLSGGEAQRVAIARALMSNPDLLLMDEPLSALGDRHKRRFLPYLEALKQHLDIPVIYVSHRPEEVARLADHLLVMDKGAVVCAGPVQEMMSRLDFPLPLGEEYGVILTGEVQSIDSRWHLAKIRIADDGLSGSEGVSLWVRAGNHVKGEALRIRVLARDISLSRSHHTDSSILNIISAQVTDIPPGETQGMVLVKMVAGGQFLVARITGKSAELLSLDVGDRLYAQIKSVALL